MMDGEMMNHCLREQFIHPPDEFTPIPMWFWNDQLDKSEILRQIGDFHSKGVSGFIIHPRIGIPEGLRFLSEEFLDFMEIAIEEADKRDMTVFLYDEAMYPSGSAHGRIVKENPGLASRGIKVLEYKASENTDLWHIINHAAANAADIKVVSVQAAQKLSEKEIDEASTAVIPQEQWKNTDTGTYGEDCSILVFIEAETGGVIRGIHFGEDDHEAGAPPYPDVLHPACAMKFIEIVHETFYRRFSKHFGNTVKAIFTDEPRPLAKGSPSCFKPWTEGFLNYLEMQGFKEKQLPMLWYEAGPSTARVRKNFERLVKKRLGEVFYRPVSDWCQSHGIALAGHPMDPDDMELEKFFHIPGQDIVLRRVEPGKASALEGPESTQAKCTSDAARHLGRRRNSNECFGAYGWELTEDEMKWILDWLFVRGVNMIIPHAFYYSIRGERYFERPPDVGPNNVWWPEYKKLSDYIKRLSWLMTDSMNLARVAVLCRGDSLPWEAAKILFANQLEFNYLQEELLLSEKCNLQAGAAIINGYSYRLIIVEESLEFLPETGVKLEDFKHQGGTVIGFTPGMDKNSLVNDIESACGRCVKLEPPNDQLRISHILKEDIGFYLLVNEGEAVIEGRLTINNCGKLEKWDPWNGSISIPDDYGTNSAGKGTSGMTTVPIILRRRESLIYAVDHRLFFNS